MSEWKMARLTVTPKTPIHCGERPMGFVAQTLPFVPSQVPLLSLVPAIVREKGMADVWSDYKKVEKFLSENVCFTPFLVMDGQRHLTPAQGLEDRYIGSRYGVGIDYTVRGAREGYLFEIEAILPVTRVGKDSVPTRLLGYVFWKRAEKDGLTIDKSGAICGKPLADYVKLCQWGGERGKGYGYLARVEQEDAADCFGAAFDSSGERPGLSWPPNEPSPFYLGYDEILTEKVSGRMKPLVGRIFAQEGGAGQASKIAGVVWEPGWKSNMAVSMSLHERHCLHVC